MTSSSKLVVIGVGQIEVNLVLIYVSCVTFTGMYALLPGIVQNNVVPAGMIVYLTISIGKYRLFAPEPTPIVV